MKNCIVVSAVALAALSATAARAKAPRQFLDDAIRGDNSEIALGQLAQQRGQSQAVRDFGTMLVRDHTSAKSQAAGAAQSLGVPVPGGMMPQAVSERARLQRLSGAAFDREFKRYMVDDHRKDIHEFEQQAGSGERTTADLAKRTLPTLRKHLETAEGLT